MSLQEEGARDELFTFSCVGVGCLVAMTEVPPLQLLWRRKPGESRRAMQWQHLTTCCHNKGTGTDIILALLGGPSTLWERAERKRSQPSTSSQFPNYSKVCPPPHQTEARGCMYVWKEDFSRHGQSHPSHQAILNSNRSSLHLFCSPASLRAVTEGSRYFLLICLQTQRLLQREREYSVPHIRNRQNEMQSRPHLQQGSFGKAFWQLRPGITWILQQGGHLPRWGGGLDGLSSSPVFCGAQKPSLQSSITDSLIPARHSMMCSGTASALWWL